MDVLKTLLVVTIGLSIAKKIAKGVLRVVILLGIVAYVVTKILV